MGAAVVVSALVPIVINIINDSFQMRIEHQRDTGKTALIKNI
jgi:hypothetical protein